MMEMTCFNAVFHILKFQDAATIHFQVRFFSDLFPLSESIYALLYELRLLFVLATEHTLLRVFSNIWRQILFPGDLHDDALYNFCTTECGTFNCPRGLQLPARLSTYQCTFT